MSEKQKKRKENPIHTNNIEWSEPSVRKRDKETDFFWLNVSNLYQANKNLPIMYELIIMKQHTSIEKWWFLSDIILCVVSIGRIKWNQNSKTKLKEEEKSGSALFGINKVNSRRKVKVKLQFANQVELANHIQLLITYTHTHTDKNTNHWYRRIRTHRENTYMKTRTYNVYAAR